MPKNRLEPVGNSRLIKKEFDIPVEQDAQLGLLATWWDTTRSGTIRRILNDHLQNYIDAIYQEAGQEAKVRRKANRSRQKLSSPEGEKSPPGP